MRISARETQFGRFISVSDARPLHCAAMAVFRSKGFRASFDSAFTDLDRTLEAWFRKEQRQYAQAKADLNYLAHALIYADRHAEARPVLDAIGEHVTRLPWAYTGDPESSFTYWRQRLLGS
jgi:hypothetical protein